MKYSFCKNFIGLCILGLLLVSCRKSKPLNSLYPFSVDSSKTVHGGVVLTFDDTYVDDWIKLDEHISKTYKWKATFFVSKYNTLNKNQTQELVHLQNKNHEIGYHGTHHTDAVKYLKDHTLQQYVDYEFSDELPEIEKEGIKLSSFAYPYGSHNNSSDSLLLKSFSKLRLVDTGAATPALQKCYYNNSPFAYAIGIEDHYKYFNLNYLTNLLNYARDNNKILVIYSHRPVIKANLTKHEVSYSVIDYICKYVNDNDMQMLRFKDM